MQIGDAVLNFTAKTEDLDKNMNELFDRIERTVQAARKAWNDSPTNRVEQFIHVRSANGIIVKVRATQDEQGNWHDCWTGAIITPSGIVTTTS